MYKKSFIKLIILILILAFIVPLSAKEKLPRESVIETPAIGEGLCLHNLFQSHMVIQREKPVSVWGWADPGEKVTVNLAGKTETTTAANDRSWKVTFPAMEANSDPITMMVKGKEKELKLENILVGDVWVLGGQSNMEFSLKGVENGPLEMAMANHPGIRILTIPRAAAPTPPEGFARMMEWNSFLSFHERKGYWDVCTPETVGYLSAIGYVFASRVHMATKVPIGVVDVSVGGTTVEEWTPLTVLRAIEAQPVKDLIANLDQAEAEWDPVKDLEKRMEIYNKKVEGFKSKGKAIPGRLKTPPTTRPRPSKRADFPGNRYEGIIAPLKGLKAKGAIFHQGFNNSLHWESTRRYGDIFPEMITAWRATFEDPKMPFGILSLCTAGDKQNLKNYSEMMADLGAYIRNAQFRTFLRFYRDGDENIGFASTYDLRRRWFHPKLKRPAGERIARWALVTQYGFRKKSDKLYWLPPIFKETKAMDGALHLHMETPVGATDDGGPIEGFAIAGSDRKFHPAQAKLVNNKTIILKSPMVSEPQHFRYAWARNPMGNMIGHWQPDLPMPTQRSDNWPLDEYFIDGKIQKIEAWFPARKAKGYYQELDRERAIKEAEALLQEVKQEEK